MIFSTLCCMATLLAAEPVQTQYRSAPHNQVRLFPSEFSKRTELNRAYVMSLDPDNLLQNFYFEAGLKSYQFREKARMYPWIDKGYGSDIHWGWESPTCQLRGHFLGHWLSAAAQLYATTGDARIKARADYIVSELARCQRANGGEWAASIPEKYFYWIAEGRSVWAPHYTVHKSFMGLIDMYKYTGNEQALDIANNFARWFHRWTGQFTREEMDNILDVETGGMLEVWSDLYGITGDRMYLDLIARYDRERLFEPLLAGEDPLTNHHANTTIPEAQGAARAYEVTGEQRWRDVAETYWKCAVTDRGYFCTGGQTSGEVWNPPFEFSARLTESNQEHCTVYNMIRLSDYLYRWSGDVKYLDYIERNMYNGILAQQNQNTGMISYFIPMMAGAKKTWGSPTNDFWCCHGSLVQANAMHNRFIYYESDNGFTVAQYIPSELSDTFSGEKVTIRQRIDSEGDSSQAINSTNVLWHKPDRQVIDLTVTAPSPVTFAISLRIPWWITGDVTITVDGEETTLKLAASTMYTIERTWQNDRIRIVLPKALTVCPLPDDPDMVAFMDGPVVLAGICDGERLLIGDKNKPETILTPDNERLWNRWENWYRVKDQGETLFFRPLYQITDERYTLYFPVQKKR